MTSVTAATLPAGGTTPASVRGSPAPGFDLLLGCPDGEPDGASPLQAPASVSDPGLDPLSQAESDRASATTDERDDASVPMIGPFLALLPAAAAAPDPGRPEIPGDASEAPPARPTAAAGGPALPAVLGKGMQAPLPGVATAALRGTGDAASAPPLPPRPRPGQATVMPAGSQPPEAEQLMSRQGATPVPVLVETGGADRSPAAGGVRAARAGVALAAATASAESAGAPRSGDAATPPPIVAAADVGSQGAQSGPERTEAGGPPQPASPLPDAWPEDPAPVGEEHAGHVHSARLTLGSADRLSVTLAAASEASRALLEGETGQLASDLAAAGAKVEAIRVDLVTRVNPDGRADGAGGQHPGPEQGGGAPWERGARPERAAARTPDAPGEVRPPRTSGPGAADGGKVDRYA